MIYDRIPNTNTSQAGSGSSAGPSKPVTRKTGQTPLSKASIPNAPTTSPLPNFKRESWPKQKHGHILKTIKDLISRCDNESLNSLALAVVLSTTAQQERWNQAGSISQMSRLISRVRATQEMEYMAAIHARWTLIEFAQWFDQEMKSRTSSVASGGEGVTNNSAIMSIKEDLIKADPASPTKTRAYQLSYWGHLIKSGQYWTILKIKLSPAALFLPKKLCFWE
ncbi:hypothetical protein MMC29_005054, partial [Sticta canariensis]|nr:hypothetical protein [Sticta canariensis]